MIEVLDTEVSFNDAKRFGGNVDPLQSEFLRQLAAFKLLVKRNYQRNIDLELLVNDADYARRCLGEIENLAETEEVLLTVLQLRQRLLPSAAKPAPQPAPAEKPPEEPGRKYMFGARSW